MPSCGVCSTGDPLAFSPTGAARKRCRPCHATYMREWNARNRDKVRERNREYKTRDGGERYKNSYLKTRYGIGTEQYEALLSSQGGVCAICKEPESSVHNFSGKTKRLAVDHCHVTNVVRGLLCSKCNTALGSLGDNVGKLLAAARYLKKER